MKMFAVEYYSYWNGYFNVFEREDFDSLEDAKAFAETRYMTTIYRRVPSTEPNSIWMFEEVK